MPQRLDDPEFVRKNDPKGMLDYTMGFPEQCRKALSISRSADAPREMREKPLVAVLGVGGSAAGGDFLRALFEAEGSAPCIVVRDYDLPNYVDEDSLVIACSYSGNTEETLTAVESALARGCKVAAVTSGGELARLCEKNGLPLIQIPGGQPPRTALGYLFIPLASLCANLGYIPQPDFDAAFSELETCAELWSVQNRYGENPTKTLAAYLFGRVPIIYGLGPWQGVVANRWKAQLNENSKIMAFANTFPELNHNEIMGWQLADRQNVANWATVILESGEESKRMQARAKVTRDVFYSKSESFTVDARGETLLSQMLTLTYFGDFVSIYLAALYGVDPETIDAINLLKKTLAELH